MRPGRLSLACLLLGLSVATARAQAPVQPPTTPTTPAAETEAPSMDPMADEGRALEHLFFTVDEIFQIEEAIASGPLRDRGGVVGASLEEALSTDPVPRSDIKISSILYFSPDSWTVWVNGKKMGPADESEFFDVVNVDPDFVVILVPWHTEPFRLRPNQTLNANSGTVIEGSGR